MQNKHCADRGLSVNPYTVRSAGGFSKALEVVDTAMGLSGRDHMNLPTASSLPFIGGELPYSDRVFWPIVKTYIEHIRISESIRFSRAKKDG